MKIVISSPKDTTDSLVDMRFGRARYFACYDTDSKETTFHLNEQNLNAPQGAGIQSAQKVADLGADAIITGHCGPKAFTLLNSASINVYLVQPETKIMDAIEMVQTGKLTATKGADVEGHWV